MVEVTRVVKQDDKLKYEVKKGENSYEILSDNLMSLDDLLEKIKEKEAHV